MEEWGEGVGVGIFFCSGREGEERGGEGNLAILFSSIFLSLNLCPIYNF